MSDVAPTPVIKSCGGKTRLLQQLMFRMPKQFGRYYEPFAGGAALFFRLQPERAVLADANHGLIGMYRVLARDPSSLTAELSLHRASHNREHYYHVRDRWNDRAATWTSPGLAAAFIYLNKTCYNGLWRVNKAGEFNVPMGRYVNPTIYVPDALVAASKVLARAEIRFGDYRDTTADAQPGDFAYFDPPYHPVGKTADFTSYTAGGFGPDQQAQLAEYARNLASRGVQVMLSNSNTRFIRKLYSWAKIHRVKCSRPINSKPGLRGKVDELIITAGY